MSQVKIPAFLGRFFSAVTLMLVTLLPVTAVAGGDKVEFTLDAAGMSELVRGLSSGRITGEGIALFGHTGDFKLNNSGRRGELSASALIQSVRAATATNGIIASLGTNDRAHIAFGGLRGEFSSEGIVAATGREAQVTAAVLGTIELGRKYAGNNRRTATVRLQDTTSASARDPHFAGFAVHRRISASTRR